jgi:hypothetical protein
MVRHMSDNANRKVIYDQKLTCMAILWNHPMRSKDCRLPGRNALGASRSLDFL